MSDLLVSVSLYGSSKMKINYDYNWNMIRGEYDYP